MEICILTLSVVYVSFVRASHQIVAATKPDRSRAPAPLSHRRKGTRFRQWLIVLAFLREGGAAARRDCPRLVYGIL